MVVKRYSLTLISSLRHQPSADRPLVGFIYFVAPSSSTQLILIPPSSANYPQALYLHLPFKTLQDHRLSHTSYRWHTLIWSLGEFQQRSTDLLVHLDILSTTTSFQHRQSEKPHHLQCHSSNRTGTPLFVRIFLNRSMRGEVVKSTLPVLRATRRMLEKPKPPPQVRLSWMARSSDPYMLGLRRACLPMYMASTTPTGQDSQ